MRTRDTKGRFIKRIDQSVKAPKTSEETKGSMVGSVISRHSLNPVDAYMSNVHVRKAIESIAINVGKADRRLFPLTSDDEIISGGVYDFVQKHITQSDIERQTSSWELHGELITWMKPTIEGIVPTLLDPMQVSPMPFNAQSIEEITHWQLRTSYNAAVEIPAEQVIFEANYNPNSLSVRGLSKALTGSTQITTNYLIGQFNKATFTNGGHKDIIIKFPKGTSPDAAKEYVEKWCSSHNIAQGGAFKVGAIIGEEVEILEAGGSAKDGQYMQIQGENADAILSLWHVPPIIAGIFSKTRFDSAEVEMESFAEMKLLPTGQIIQGHNQKVIDFVFKGLQVGKKRSVPLTRSLSKALSKARNEAKAGSVLFLLDFDSTPLMATLRAKHLAMADDYRKKMAVSFAAAAEWAGIDRESNAADELIFIESGQQQVQDQNTKEIEALKAQMAQMQANQVNNQQETPKAPETPENTDPQADPEEIDNLKAFMKEYRRMMLESADKNEVFDKDAVLKLLESHDITSKKMQLQIHKDFLAVTSLLKSDFEGTEKLRMLKKRLNVLSSRKSLKQLAIG